MLERIGNEEHRRGIIYLLGSEEKMLMNSNARGPILTMHTEVNCGSSQEIYMRISYKRNKKLSQNLNSEYIKYAGSASTTDLLYNMCSSRHLQPQINNVLLTWL